MSQAEHIWFELITNLSIWKRAETRAVHKPLLTLILLARAQSGKSNLVHFNEIVEPLEKCLKEFGPPRKHVHPEYPFWYLQNDGFWIVRDANRLPLRKGKAQPTRTALIKYDTLGEVPEELWAYLINEPRLTKELARHVLEEFWPNTYHEDIATAIGLDIEASSMPQTRNPEFREMVLTSYERRCAFCNYDGRLSDSLFALEAAHIKFWQDGGPDIVTNGLALCSLHHKAFDYGAMSLDFNLRICVSQHVVGNKTVRDIIVRFNGQSANAPQSKKDYPAREFIEWHRANVFRKPAREFEVS